MSKHQPQTVSPHPVYSGREFDYAPAPRVPDILYKDDHFLIANKPAGLLSVPGKAEKHADCLETRIQTIHPEARTVHRLDMSTSGVMVFAMSATAHRHLGLQFERRHVSKTYTANIWGNLRGATGRINLPLVCDWPNRPLQMVDFGKGKSATTDWEVAEDFDQYTNVLLHPITGRSHQLRVHMREIGHPILGDRLYAPDNAYEASERLCLHATTLSFRHPEGGAHVSFHSPCPF